MNKIYKVKDLVYNNNFHKIKLQYSDDYLKSIEEDQSKIKTFHEFVMPSFEYQILIPTISSKIRWACLFEDCSKMSTFASKQSYVRHLIVKHGKSLPLDGHFLSPRSSYFKPGGFVCDICNIEFKRIDHFKKHKTICLEPTELVIIDEDEEEDIKYKHPIKSLMWLPDWHLENDHKSNITRSISNVSLASTDIIYQTQENPKKNSLKRELSNYSYFSLLNSDKKNKTPFNSQCTHYELSDDESLLEFSEKYNI